MEWETMSANDMTDKGLIFKIYTQLIELNILKSRLKNRQKTWIDIFPKKTFWWPTGTWKVAQRQRRVLSEKCKSKPRDTTSHLPEWPSPEGTPGDCDALSAWEPLVYANDLCLQRALPFVHMPFLTHSCNSSAHRDRDAVVVQSLGRVQLFATP